MTHLVIIGGSDAGISAALRARELNPTVQVTMIVADAFPNYSICGLPFYLSGEVPDWHMLAHRTEEEITREGIEILLNQRVIHVDPTRHDLTIIDNQQQLSQLSYDRLIIATGAVPVLPHIAGIDLPGVFPLHTMADSFAVEHYLESMAPRSAVIIGGGYIGLEMADALTLRGLAVTVVEHNPTVLKTVDPSFGQMVAIELEKHGVRVVPSVRIEGISRVETHLEVRGTQQFSAQADMVLVAVGVRPATELAKKAGVVTEFHDAIRVTQRMETNISDIYAAGDCVETWHRLLQAPTYLPLGTTSHKQGRVAGENAVGGHREFAGSLGTQVVKVFDLAIARTGLREDEAKEARFAPITVVSEFWDHKVYYPGAHRMYISLTGDQETGRLLGAQMIGHWQGEIAKRVDIFAAALFHQMKIEEINDLDLSYTPPLSSPWDPVQMSAQAWLSASTKLQKV